MELLTYMHERYLDSILFFSTNDELSYTSNNYVWAYSETQIELGVCPTVWSGFTLLITASVSASLVIFRCLLYGILNILKTVIADSGIKHSDWIRWVFRLTEFVYFFGTH